MSALQTTRVWQHSRSRGTDRLVMLAIADEANDAGLYESTRRVLADKCGVSPSTVQLAVSRLVEAGELVVVGSDQKGTRYRIVLTEGDDRPDREPVDPTESRSTTPTDSTGNRSTDSTESRSTSSDALLFNHDSPLSPLRGDIPPRGETATPRDRRATRIPEPFVVSDDMLQWVREQLPTLGPQRVAAITEQFVDYWRAVGGARGRKTDWPATWRNWLRREAERGGPVGRRVDNRHRDEVSADDPEQQARRAAWS